MDALDEILGSLRLSGGVVIDGDGRYRGILTLEAVADALRAAAAPSGAASTSGGTASAPAEATV